ncbi:S8 family peptidase [Dyadobacter sediminis]|uniref:T9SS type A sorting domain-containing protein n=1 Tax=Dyadobacter sediminis TaxID=1493691 RepID=A0A5R9KAR7_9BACT|nr:S8 family peptidase [Dyadobacter sediminis]TLU91817.1 T9SS type A sorting domain-containing protein [Dyadobacter sediminis]GGC00042.1 serine protease [Dyadobacter sediminis]
MIRTLLAAFVTFSLISFHSFAQSNPRYLVLYKDKINSPFSTDKPSDFLSERAIMRRTRQNIALTTRDFPVNPAYVTAVKQTGAAIVFSSRWFNGSVVEASVAQLEAIKKLPFYKGIELNLPVANLNSKSEGVERIHAGSRKLETEEDLDYGSMNAQLALMQVAQHHQKGYHGENMLIAVMDNGFNSGDKVGFLKPLRDENRIVDTYDFMARESNVYNDGSHGLNVLSTMAAYLPGTMIGAAFKASYALYRSENDYIESPYEEITWLMAAERADSIGADVINTSLGYSYFDNEFNRPEYNYTYADMDGKTTIISRAARFATRTGMLVVCAAGNEGDNAWHYIAAPADVDSVLTVGATNYERSYAPLSSVGPNAAGQQKPDVAAVGLQAVAGNTAGNVSGLNGTSLASPQIAGLCAILWQAYPQLTAQEIIKVVKMSGHQATAPDNLLGYGVPDLVKAVEYIDSNFKPLGTESETIRQIVIAPNPAQKELVLTIPAALVGKKANLALYGVNGASLGNMESQLAASQVISTAHLSSGLYFLRIRVNNQERALKFIKQ